MVDGHKRSVVKGATWRVIGTLDTIFLSYVFTGLIGTALKIGGIELFTKIFLFYLHERAWGRVTFGTKEKIINGKVKKIELHSRSIVIGISWRIIGSLDTFWIALVVNSDSSNAVQTAFYITATEVFTKIFLFWLHERAWTKVKWGRR
ncbi:MAG: DUF2061 domain-containing protein [Bacteroidota bacterium]